MYGSSKERVNRRSRGKGSGSARPAAPPGLIYEPRFVTPEDRRAVLAWLTRLHPIWEMRYSIRRAPAEGQLQRRLLRPVYWLGSWQFACLDYYRPPGGVSDRCVRAEPFPPVIAKMVQRIEAKVRRAYRPEDLPPGWRLNTCLVNLYGSRTEDGKKIDSARVGEHKDHEPGPVASVSLGERALFQFVESRHPGQRSWPIAQQWLDDGSLQVFGGDYWKKRVFHRVQRVDRRAGQRFPIAVPGFQTRRVNFTFRYVPEQHVVRFLDLAPQAREDVRPYVEELAKHSEFFARELAGR